MQDAPDEKREGKAVCWSGRRVSYRHSVGSYTDAESREGRVEDGRTIKDPVGWCPTHGTYQLGGTQSILVDLVALAITYTTTVGVHHVKDTVVRKRGKRRGERKSRNGAITIGPTGWERRSTE
jgi:hypothetical protein